MGKLGHLSTDSVPHWRRVARGFTPLPSREEVPIMMEKALQEKSREHKCSEWAASSMQKSVYPTCRLTQRRARRGATTMQGWYPN